MGPAERGFALPIHHVNPTDVMDAKSVIGVYASASRQKTSVFDPRTGRATGHGPWQQVSRLGNALFNEVIVPMAKKDGWNAVDPWNDSAFAQYVANRGPAERHPEPVGTGRRRRRRLPQRPASGRRHGHGRAARGGRPDHPARGPQLHPDGATSVIKDGTSNTNSPYLDHFPYLGTPAGGYQTTPGTPAA